MIAARSLFGLSATFIVAVAFVTLIIVIIKLFAVVGKAFDSSSGPDDLRWRRGASYGRSTGEKTCDSPRCGQVNPPEARFCARCGHRLS